MSLAVSGSSSSSEQPATYSLPARTGGLQLGTRLREFADFLRGNVNLDPELRRAQAEVMIARAQVLIWISVFVMPSCILSYVFFNRPERFMLAATIVGAAIIAVLLLAVLIRGGIFRGKEQLAMLVLVGGVFGPVGAIITVVSPGHSGNFFFSFFLIYFAFTALFPADVKWVLATSAALIVSYLGANWLDQRALAMSAELTNNLIYLAELTFIGVVLNRVLCRLFFDERRAQQELRGARDALFSEMEVAQEIQTLLLPKNPQLEGNIVSGLMVPATEVGGDYYDVIISNNGRTFIAIGDVSGHGVTSGLTMMMARASLLGALEASPTASLESLYQILNRCLRQNLERMELSLYMTFALFEHLGDGRFRGVGRHLPALIYRKERDLVEEVDLEGIWLGILPDVTADLLPAATIQLAPGDLLFLYTDGIVEHEGATGMFGFERLKTLIQLGARDGAAELIAKVMRELNAYSSKQEDDVTMLAVNHTGQRHSTRITA
jgi:sigma-B regulation protein RsbU (phosphoserine phosphatase)